MLGVEVAAELLYIAGVGASVPLNAPGESLDLHWDERGKQPGVVKVYFAGLLERTTLCDLHRGLERFAFDLSGLFVNRFSLDVFSTGAARDFLQISKLVNFLELLTLAIG